jgi:hypothetical protein
MNIDKKRFLDSLFLSVLVINFLFMIFFAGGLLKLSTSYGGTIETYEEPYRNKVSVTIAETTSAGPPFYLNLWILSVINVISILLFAGLVYFVKDYFDRKQ